MNKEIMKRLIMERQTEIAGVNFVGRRIVTQQYPQ